MQNNPLVLTLDFGTQSVRTSLIDKQGNIVYLSKKAYEPMCFSAKKGYAEQHADFYWENLIDCLKELSQNSKENLDRIIAFTVTTFRDSAVLLDKEQELAYGASGAGSSIEPYSAIMFDVELLGIEK